MSAVRTPPGDAGQRGPCGPLPCGCCSFRTQPVLGVFSFQRSLSCRPPETEAFLRMGFHSDSLTIEGLDRGCLIPDGASLGAEQGAGWSLHRTEAKLWPEGIAPPGLHGASMEDAPGQAAAEPDSRSGWSPSAGDKLRARAGSCHPSQCHLNM